MSAWKRKEAEAHLEAGRSPSTSPAARMPARPALMASASRGCGHSPIAWLYDPQLKQRCAARARPSDISRTISPCVKNNAGVNMLRKTRSFLNALGAELEDDSDRRLMEIH
jgi:hypothetical protein